MEVSEKVYKNHKMIIYKKRQTKLKCQYIDIVSI